jgi:hypothetical protein
MEFGNVRTELSQLESMAGAAAAEAARTHEHINNIQLANANQPHSAPIFSWDTMSPEDQGLIVAGVVANFDIPELVD